MLVYKEGNCERAKLSIVKFCFSQAAISSFYSNYMMRDYAGWRGIYKSEICVGYISDEATPANNTSWRKGLRIPLSR